MALINSGAASSTTYDPNKSYTGALVVLTSLFFIWAFITSLNDILMPHLQKALDLSDFESAFIQSAFFGAYFIVSIPAGMLIERIGYKPGIIFGLGLIFIGALIFVPAATSRTFELFLGALFIMASGITILQVAANPYVSVLGPPETSSMRLNLTQAFNSLGATLGPLIFGAIIFSGAAPAADYLQSLSPEDLEKYKIGEAHAVIGPYIGLAALVAVIALAIYLSKLPKIDSAEDAQSKADGSAKKSIFSYSHLLFGVMSIFFYVGAEVAIGSFIIKFAMQKDIANILESEAKNYVGAYMFLAMVGRFAGAAVLSKLKANKLLSFLVLGAITLLAVTLMTDGMLALYAVVAVGLCNSIMFPTIFTLAIKDLGSHTKQGSSFLIMAIVGGAIVPLLVGKVSDSQGIHQAFIVPMLCYLPILFFALVGYKTKSA